MNCKHHLLGLVVAVSLGPLLAAQDQKKPDAASGKVAPADAPVVVDGSKAPSGSGNSWFTVTDLDLGTRVGSEEAVGTFPFRNPRDKAVDWKNIAGSCTCTKAIIRLGPRRYELVSKPEKQLVRLSKNSNGQEVREVVTQLTVDPGETGEVEVHMEMHGVTGPRQASLDIHTNDDALPQIKLKWHATGAQLFTISPAEVNLNKMTWNESREFTVSVTSPIKKDFNIKRMDDAGKAFQVTYDKAMIGDVATWTIHGKYGPVDGETGGGGVLKFYTDVQGEASFLVRVMAFVQGPLEVKPGGFLMFGRIPKGTELKKEIVFEPNDGVKIEATKLAFEKLTVKQEYLTVAQRQDNGKLVLEVVVSKDAPEGLLKGELVVTLNHPLVKEKRIMFNGYVR